MVAAHSSSVPRLTVYFDGGCPVCSREIANYRRQPGADSCVWVDATVCPEACLGPDLVREDALARFHVRDADGQLISGMRGFAFLWASLPRTAWLGRLAGWGPFPDLLEAGYSAFLKLRRLWRPAAAACVPRWAPEVEADLRSNHAGETGALHIYRGVLATSRDPALRDFAARHLATEKEHLVVMERHLPATQRSWLLPAWRVAGWLTGALPALLGPRAVFATVAAVETFVDRHYGAQVARLDQRLRAEPDARLAELRDDLERCRIDEVHHRDDALRAGPATGRWVGFWSALIGGGSSAAVALARKF